MITREQIEEVIGPVELAASPNTVAHPSPGMHQRHYSPRKPLAITSTPPERSAYLWWSVEAASALSIQLSVTLTSMPHALPGFASSGFGGCGFDSSRAGA
ncbi:MAG: Sua5 family C-terminal domain-containing protein [Bryobacteraceae bacterium]